jgi:sirohydrochlorin cobaltochelatase
MRKQGIMICGHGSRSKDAEREFGLLAAGLKKRFPETPVEYGFLEYSAPNIHMGLNALRDAGVDRIIAVPGMLFAATHAKKDIPSVLTTYQEKNPKLQIKYGRELGLHSQMISAFKMRILDSLGLNHVHDGDLYDTMLVVVGRGTSDTYANAEVAKLTRIVTEDLGFGWSETVYSGVTFPSVGQGLSTIVRLGYKKIVVAPYFLFTGRLIDRIYNYVNLVAKENPQIKFHKAHYLADQDHVINTFVERIDEINAGKITENFDLMESFKDQLSKGEINIHHHHAEYKPLIDPDDDEAVHDHGHQHEHSHKHEHEHSHKHNHGVYKHISHPNGPRTMIDEGVCCCFMSQFPDHVIEEQRKINIDNSKKDGKNVPVTKRK